MLDKFRESLPRRLSITDMEYEIRSMEVELVYHREKVRIFEETLQEQQKLLSELQQQEHEKYIGGDL